MQLRRVDARYTVVGIVEREPGPMPGAGIQDWMIPPRRPSPWEPEDVSSLQSMLPICRSRAEVVRSLTVKVTRRSPPRTWENQIKGSGLHGLFTQRRAAGRQARLHHPRLVLSLIGSIALAVYVARHREHDGDSILERTREIGIMKRIGRQRRRHPSASS